MNHVASEFTRLATLSHLPALLAFLDAEAQAAGIDDATLFPLHLAVEEACANVIRHAYPDQPGPLTLRLDITPQTATATLLDTAPVFDPVHAPTPPLEGAVEERPLGGLGWHFIRSLMDEVRHEAQPEGGNRLTLIKHRPTNS
ncbi:MAG: ATP-binding protein [Bacteroidota bacterium]